MKKQFLALIALWSAVSLYAARVDVPLIEIDPSSEPGSPDEPLHDVDPLLEPFEGRRPSQRSGGVSSQSGQGSSFSSLKTSPAVGQRGGLDDSEHIEVTPRDEIPGANRAGVLKSFSSSLGDLSPVDLSPKNRGDGGTSPTVDEAFRDLETGLQTAMENFIKGTTTAAVFVEAVKGAERFVQRNPDAASIAEPYRAMLDPLPKETVEPLSAVFLEGNKQKVMDYLDDLVLSVLRHKPGAFARFFRKKTPSPAEPLPSPIEAIITDALGEITTASLEKLVGDLEKKLSKEGLSKSEKTKLLENITNVKKQINNKAELLRRLADPKAELTDEELSTLKSNYLKAIKIFAEVGSREALLSDLQGTDPIAFGKEGHEEARAYMLALDPATFSPEETLLLARNLLGIDADGMTTDVLAFDANVEILGRVLSDGLLLTNEDTGVADLDKANRRLRGLQVDENGTIITSTGEKLSEDDLNTIIKPWIKAVEALKAKTSSGSFLDLIKTLDTHSLSQLAHTREVEARGKGDKELAQIYRDLSLNFSKELLRAYTVQTYVMNVPEIDFDSQDRAHFVKLINDISVAKDSDAGMDLRELLDAFKNNFNKKWKAYMARQKAESSSTDGDVFA